MARRNSRVAHRSAGIGLVRGGAGSAIVMLSPPPASIASTAVSRTRRRRRRNAQALLDQAQVELRTERGGPDASLSELRDQLAQLLARRPARDHQARSDGRRLGA